MIFNFGQKDCEEESSGIDMRALGIPSAISGESADEAVGVTNLTVRRGASGHFDDMDAFLKIDGDEVDIIPKDSEFEYNIVLGPHVFEFRVGDTSTFFDIDIDSMNDYAFEFAVNSEGKVENLNC